MTDNHEPPSAIFARKVRQLRAEAGWSQAELGRRLALAGHGLRQSRIAAVERAGSVSIDQADAFAVVFSVPLEVLLYEKPPASRGVRVHRLMKIAAAADRLNQEIGRLIDDGTAD
jgi:transcriptional regulator with XRE-family HTH domain